MKLLFTPAGLIIIAAVAVIIFAPRRLPEIAKSLRRPMRAFDEEPREADSAAEEHDG